MTQAEKEAAKAAKLAEKEAAKDQEEQESSDEFIVGDPQVLRPVELPLVIKLPEGKSWKNKEQEEYARTLNGYAYKNPSKWHQKKNDTIANGMVIARGLLTKLREIGEDPSKLNMYKGVQEDKGNLQFNNKLIQQ